MGGDPTRVRMTGPLAPYASSFALELTRSGYTRHSTADQLRVLARDLVVAKDHFGGDLAEANRQARWWGIEVNGRIHSEIQAVPTDRLAEERPLMRPLPSLRPALCRGALRKVNKTQTIRFGSARYSLPTGWVGKLVEVSVAGGDFQLAKTGDFEMAIDTGGN